MPCLSIIYLMEKIKKILTEYLPYLGVSLLISLPWFFKPGYLFFTDLPWGPTIKTSFTNNWFFTETIFILFNYIIPSDIIQKLFLTVIFLTLLLTAKHFIKNFTKNKWLSLALSSFALFNPFVYDRLGYGQVGILLSLGFTILTISFFIKFLNNFQYKNLVWAGISTGLAIMYSMHLIFIILPFYLLFLILIMFKIKKVKIHKLIIFLVLISLIIIIINLNWLYPFLKGSSGQAHTVNQTINQQHYQAFQTAGRSETDALKNVLMMSGFWGKENWRYKDLTKFKQNWGVSFILLLPLFIYGFYNGLKNKNYRQLTIGLTIIFIISATLALGIRAGIIKNITYWAFENIPAYKGLRETQKWVLNLVVIYFFFLTLGSVKIFKSKIISKNFLPYLTLLIIIILQAPLLVWGMAGQVKPAQYPNDWYQVNQYILEETNCQSKTLFLPWHLYMGFGFIGNITTNPAKLYFDCPIISGDNMEIPGVAYQSHSPKNQLIHKWLQTQGQAKILQELNIKHIILARDADWQNYSWLNDLPELELLQNNRNLILYQVKYE